MELFFFHTPLVGLFHGFPARGAVSDVIEKRKRQGLNSVLCTLYSVHHNNPTTDSVLCAPQQPEDRLPCLWVSVRELVALVAWFLQRLLDRGVLVLGFVGGTQTAAVPP